MKLPSGQPLEFILAVPGRRYSEFVDLLSLVQAQCANAPTRSKRSCTS